MKFVMALVMVLIGAGLSYLVNVRFESERGAFVRKMKPVEKRNYPSVEPAPLLARAMRIAQRHPLTKEDLKSAMQRWRKERSTRRRRLGLLGNLSPHPKPRPMWQVVVRLSSIRENGYRFQAAHRGAWKALLLRETASVYSRLCAASFLFEHSAAARSFVALQLRSENLRHRYNAARLLYLYAKKGRKHRWYKWTVGVLVQSIGRGDLNGSGVERRPRRGRFPEGDRNDIIFHSLRDIASLFVSHKVKAAVFPLLRQLDKPGLPSSSFDDIVGALGKMDDRRVIAPLIRLLKKHNSHRSIVTALGVLRAREAVPVLVGILRRVCVKKDSGFGDVVMPCEGVFEALESIGDRRALPGIRRFLRHNKNKSLVPAAMRVLVQLQYKDPVDALWRLYRSLPKRKAFFAKRNLMYALARYPAPKVVISLVEEARTSHFIYLRVGAVYALGQMKTRRSLLALVSLMEEKVPEGIDKAFCWRCLGDMTVLFRRRVLKVLELATKQSFGARPARWQRWIESHY